MAPEVFKQEEYDTKVDVFSFALILQEVTNFTVSSSNGRLVKAINYTNNVYYYMRIFYCLLFLFLFIVDSCLIWLVLCVR